MADPDLELLRSVAGGDEPALRALIEAHQNRIFHFILRHVPDESDAAEIAADTFVRVHRHAARFEPRGKVSTWIFSIALNLCRDHLRKLARRPRPAGIHSGSDDPERDAATWIDRIPDPSPGPGEAAATRETLRRTLAAIHRLPAKLREPLILHALEDMPQAECAAILGISRKAVESRIRRAREKLRQA